MTITQAHQAMKNGNKIYHKNADRCYQIYLGSFIIDGMGNDRNVEFAALKTDPTFADGWSLEAFEDDFLKNLNQPL